MLKSFAQDLGQSRPEISPGVGICERRLRQAEPLARRGQEDNDEKRPSPGGPHRRSPEFSHRDGASRARRLLATCSADRMFHRNRAALDRSRRLRGPPQIVGRRRRPRTSRRLSVLRALWANRSRSRPIRNLSAVRSIQNHCHSITGPKPRAGFTTRMTTICATAHPAPMWTSASTATSRSRRCACSEGCESIVSSPSSAARLRGQGRRREGRSER